MNYNIFLINDSPISYTDLINFLTVVLCSLLLLLGHNAVKLALPLLHKLIDITLILVLFFRNRIIFQFQYLCSAFLHTPVNRIEACDQIKNS